MDAIIRIIFFVMISVLALSCLNKTKEIKNNHAYFYFDNNKEKFCEIPNIGLNRSFRDSIKLNYYRKYKGYQSMALQDRGKLIYSFCNYGKFVFDSLSHTTVFTNNIDTLKLITPSSELDFNHSMRKNNYIVEPINDTTWRIIEVRKAVDLNIKS